MPSRFVALRFAVPLVVGVLLTGQAAGAAQTLPVAEEHVASILRSINPQLQVHESMAYARSVFADSQRSHLDPSLIVALVTVESSWRPSAVSPDGARGLGQLMPTTASKLGVNPWDPAQNLRGAAAYLRSLVNRFAGRGVDTMRYAIGAYNAGPLALERSGGPSGTSTTAHYVAKVLTQWHSLSNRIARTLLAAAPHAAAPAAPADEREWLANADASALPVTLPAAVQPASTSGN
jgi:hypothetical protein